MTKVLMPKRFGIFSKRCATLVWIKIQRMKKLPNIELKTVISVGLGVSMLGFCLMMTDSWMNVGAILFALGLLPLAVTLARGKD